MRGRLGRPAVPGRVRLAEPDPAAPRYADALGIALQQTNILRDIREDLLNGRVYLPRRGPGPVRRAAAARRAGRLADPDGSLARLIRFSAERARAWFADGLRLIPLLDRRSAACGRARWPASTPRCWTGSRPSPRSCTAGGCRCRCGRRPRSRPSALSGLGR